MAGTTRKPTIALLSQLFVALTIEIDSELERRMPHRTGEDRGKPGARGPLLTSLAYWQNYLRNIPDGGITARDLALLSGDSPRTMRSHLDELRRWGYVELAPVPRNPGGTVLTPTPHLMAAREHWPHVEDAVLARWRERFGTAVDRLEALLADAPTDLPVGFPVLAWESSADIPTITPTTSAELSSRLARTILARARAFDADAARGRTLAVLLDFLRVIPSARDVESGTHLTLRDLPVMSGVGKEAAAIRVGRATKVDLVEQYANAAGEKCIRLTAAAESLRTQGFRRLAELESATPGDDELRDAALAVVSDEQADAFREALHPAPGDWRGRARYRAQTTARLADPLAALPWFPMVSHRGGYPDGD